jgi:hypothetical protein
MRKTERLLSIRYDQTEYPELARQQDTLKKRGKFRQWVLAGLNQAAQGSPSDAPTPAAAPGWALMTAQLQEMTAVLHEINRAVSHGNLTTVQTTVKQCVERLQENGTLSDDLEGVEFEA